MKSIVSGSRSGRPPSSGENHMCAARPRPGARSRPSPRPRSTTRRRSRRPCRTRTALRGLDAGDRARPRPSIAGHLAALADVEPARVPLDDRLRRRVAVELAVRGGRAAVRVELRDDPERLVDRELARGHAERDAGARARPGTRRHPRAGRAGTGSRTGAGRSRPSARTPPASEARSGCSARRRTACGSRRPSG